MVHKYEPEAIQHRQQVIYTKETRERQTFMQQLNQFRKKREKDAIKAIKKAIGPKWYQTLSVPQRNALDSLETSIYQDILEGRPVRTSGIMKELGLYPRPNNIDLMNCIYSGSDDPKQMLAHLFLMTYGHEIDAQRLEYPLNAKLMLSAILYLGLDNLISLLKKKFQPEPKISSVKEKPKPKIQPSLKSPYLQEMTAVTYVPPKREAFRPAPLPNLDDLNEPFEEDDTFPKGDGLSTHPSTGLPKHLIPSGDGVSKPPPLGGKGLPKPKSLNGGNLSKPLLAPPKKRLKESDCDKLAGITRIKPYSSDTSMKVETVTRTTHKNKLRKSKLFLSDAKKTYGISMAFKKARRRKKPVAPCTGVQNAQYTINGVYTINGKSFFVLGGVYNLPPDGDLIHGGFVKYMGGDVINLHCGFRGRPPPPKPDPCDCVNKWQDAVFEYVKENKCRCGHYYDYGNEGTFSPSELPYFEIPTGFSPYRFNYDTIYDLDEKHLFVRKQFKKFWDTDSVLHIGDAAIRTDKKKKKIKRSSTTCLGNNPSPKDYLMCALRQMRQINIAAKLPDIHLVPELEEWMRRRINGPFSRKEKKEMLRKSITYWQTLLRLAQKGFGHVSPPKDADFTGHTTWAYKQKLDEKFEKFTQQYKLQLYRSYANFTNILWPTMFQAQFPDKSFREIYFSYLFARFEDVHLIHPYSAKEIMDRTITVGRRRYRCSLDTEVQP